MSHLVFSVIAASDLVAGLERRHQRVVQHLLAAGADGDLTGLVVEPVLALELGADRLFQRRRAVDRGVARLAALHRCDRRLLDVEGRVEIGLAGAEADDVAPGGLELGGLGGDGNGR